MSLATNEVTESNEERIELISGLGSKALTGGGGSSRSLFFFASSPSLERQNDENQHGSVEFESVEREGQGQNSTPSPQSHLAPGTRTFLFSKEMLEGKSTLVL